MSFLDSLVDAVKAGSSAIKEVNAEVERKADRYRNLSDDELRDKVRGSSSFTDLMAAGKVAKERKSE